jgi:glycosyltransferase involved in cell wall biosynthesis
MLPDAVNSVLAQSYRNFELIVVDDGSTDKTAGALDGYGDALRLISQRRLGVAAARNTGARAARGEYFAFLDSDDLWTAKKLAVQTTFMIETPPVQICQTEEVWIRRGTRVNPKKTHRKPSGDIFRRSLERCLVSPSAVMMTRRLFESVGGFDERLWVCEDYDLWLRIAIDHEVPLISRPLVVKRGGHADQLSRSMWGTDRFRVAALAKLLRSGLRGEKRRWAINEVQRKVKILSAGARKRGRQQEALDYEQLAIELGKEERDVGRADPRICAGEALPSGHTPAMARLECA